MFDKFRNYKRLKDTYDHTNLEVQNELDEKEFHTKSTDEEKPDLWQLVYFDKEEEIDSISYVLNGYGSSRAIIFDALSRVVNINKAVLSSPKHLEKLLLIISNNTIQYHFKDKDGFLISDETKRFFANYIWAIYRICINTNLDFCSLFRKIMNIVVYETKAGKIYYPWSFSYFISILEDSNGVPIINAATSKTARKIYDIIETFFVEFLSNASNKDIENLFKFGIRYEYCIPNVCDALSFTLWDDSLQDSNLLCPNLDVIKAIAQYYPSLIEPAYTYFIQKIIKVCSSNKYSETVYSAFIQYLLSAFIDISDLKKYRSEEFVDIGSSWKSIMKIILMHGNGNTLDCTIKFLNKQFGISKHKLDVFIREYFHDILLNENETFKPLSGQDIDYISKFLSCKNVYRFVLSTRQAIIDILY